jgi:hypothetical protein
LENALEEVRRREEVYSRPALKKYGDSLSSAINVYFILKMRKGERYLPTGFQGEFTEE